MWDKKKYAVIILHLSHFYKENEYEKDFNLAFDVLLSTSMLHVSYKKCI